MSGAYTYDALSRKFTGKERDKRNPTRLFWGQVLLERLGALDLGRLVGHAGAGPVCPVRSSANPESIRLRWQQPNIPGRSRRSWDPRLAEERSLQHRDQQCMCSSSPATAKQTTARQRTGSGSQQPCFATKGKYDALQSGDVSNRAANRSTSCATGGREWQASKCKSAGSELGELQSISRGDAAGSAADRQQWRDGGCCL